MRTSTTRAAAAALGARRAGQAASRGIARTEVARVVAVLAALGLAAAAFLLARSAAPPAPPPVTPLFEEVAKAAGVDFTMAFLPDEQGASFKINLYDHGCGVAVADVDGDGDDDVYFCNQLGRNALFRNDGGWRFTDVTAAAGVGLADRICVAATFADVDGDGRPDLYVTTTRAGNVLFHNRGDGTFEDVTAQAGLTLVAHSEAAVFFDADRDGDLDLLVTNTAKWTTDTFDDRQHYFRGAEGLFDLIGSPVETNRFYRNRGDGTFEDATEASGLAGVGWSGDAAILDADEDGAVDVFVSNMFGRSALYRNDGTGRFQDVTAAVLGPTSFGTMGVKPFDHDGDGRLDLYMVDMHSDMWMDPTTFRPKPGFGPKKYAGLFGPHEDPASPVQTAMRARLGYRLDGVVFGNTLFRALGGGRFAEVSDAAGLETFWPWGIATGDFDGDGAEDVFLASGMGYPFEYWPSPLLMNDGHGHFTERGRSSGVDPADGRVRGPRIRDRMITRSSRSAATADFDGDGRLDLVVNNFNGPAHLFRNRAPARGWIELKLVGAGKNRDAIGAVVRLHAGDRTWIRQVDSLCGYLAQSSTVLHVGLGDVAKVDRVEIRWPDGRSEVLGEFAAGRRHTLRQAER